MTIALHYWQTDCAPLPNSGNELFAIARCHSTTWGNHRDTILRIFSDVKPELDAHLAFRKQRRALASEMGMRGVGILRLKALARKQVAHGAREDALPTREANPKERPAAPEQRSGRARVAPGKGG